jgi:hypothetical protein
MHSKGSIVRVSVFVPVAWLVLLSCFMSLTAIAEDADHQALGGLNGPEDLHNLLRHIQHRGTQRESLFALSPLTPVHDSSAQAKQELYEATGVKLGFVFAHAF